MAHIPRALATDIEDVVWALSTAESLWKRGDHADAVVWLRRAAEAAADAQDDDRALTLAREAAELREWLEARARYADAGEGDLDVHVSMPPAAEAPGAQASSPLPQFAMDDESNEDATMVGTSLFPDEITTIPPEYTSGAPDAVSMPPDVIGLSEPPPPMGLSEPPPALEVDPVTIPPPPKKPPPLPPRPAVGSGSSKAPRPVSVAPRASSFAQGASVSARPDENMTDPAPPMNLPLSRIPLPFIAPETDRELFDADATGRLTAATVTDPTETQPPPPAEDDQAQVETSPPEAPTPAPSPAEPTPLRPEPLPEPPASDPAVPTPPPAAQVELGAPPSSVDLSEVEVFADLPDDSRDAFAKAAIITSLRRGEEVPASALALVLEGELDVSASVVDAPALTLVVGHVMRSRGTIEATLALRLIAASERATVATWSDAEVAAAFRTCPWVEDELRNVGNRIQGVCGVTIGPLGERLDASLLGQVTSRLEARAFEAGEVVVAKGAHAGIVLVGTGELLVGTGGTALGSGDFVFPEMVLGGGKATETVTAGEGGAIVLMGPRSVAQELLATCAPLVEILAGM